MYVQCTYYSMYMVQCRPTYCLTVITVKLQLTLVKVICLYIVVLAKADDYSHCHHYHCH